MTSFGELSEVLGRKLDAEDAEMLQFLSPQGIAKLNADICKGVDLKVTLSDLRTVFYTLALHRAEVQMALPATADPILARMTRPPTTEEMLFLSDPTAPMMMKLTEIQQKFDDGKALDDLVEELASEYRQKQLLFDAQRLADGQGQTVSISRLAPTVRPRELENPLASSVARQSGKGTIRLGFSPICTWFDENQRTLTEMSLDAHEPRIVSSPTACPSPLRSALRNRNTDTVSGTASLLLPLPPSLPSTGSSATSIGLRQPSAFSSVGSVDSGTDLDYSLCSVRIMSPVAPSSSKTDRHGRGPLFTPSLKVTLSYLDDEGKPVTTNLPFEATTPPKTKIQTRRCQTAPLPCNRTARAVQSTPPSCSRFSNLCDRLKRLICIRKPGK